jgi:hypothetical protein
LPALESSIPKSNQPANYDYFKEWRLAVLQMPVPGEGHEDIGERQQQNGSHECMLPDSLPLRQP